MFNRKDCKRCGERISDKYLYCPHCGNLNGKGPSKKDMGMLGDEDFINDFEEFGNSIFGGTGGRIIGKVVESFMKTIEKEIERETKRKHTGEKAPKTNFQLFINGKKIDELGAEDGEIEKQNKHEREIPSSGLPRNILKKFSTLPKNEPKTNVRRLSDKVIYEINIPGVKSLKDVSIVKLENNIEIKAVTKDKAYNKLIPINFPITNYNFSRGKLIIELDSSE